MTARDDVLAVNYLMREPLTEHEVDRVLHALVLAHYKVEKLPPYPGTPNKRKKKSRA